MEEIRQRIVVPEGITLERLRIEIDRGGRFVVFPYCISLGMLTLKRFSPSILIPAGKKPRAYIIRYNILSGVCRAR